MGRPGTSATSSPLRAGSLAPGRIPLAGAEGRPDQPVGVGDQNRDDQEQY